MMVEDSIPDEFKGRKPFQTKPQSRRSAKISQKKFEKSRIRNSRSVSRKCASKMTSQRNTIRRGATMTRQLTEGNPQSQHHFENEKIEVDGERALSVSEALSTSAFEYEKSVKSASSYHSWEETKSFDSFKSFYSEHSIQEAKENAYNENELLDLDTKTIAQMSRRSSSKNKAGQIIYTLNGQFAPKNEPVRGEEEDEMSDIEADFDTIDHNLNLNSLHMLNKKMKYAVFNKPAQRKLNKTYKDMTNKIRDKQLHGRQMAFKEDDKENDKENQRYETNYKDVSQGLQTGALSYKELKFPKEAMKYISFGDEKA